LDTLNNHYSIFYKNKYDETKVLSMQGSQLLINYMVKYNPKIKMSANPWKIISEKTNFFNELEVARKNAHSGSGIKLVRFLSSDPKVLMNKLKILLAEKSAGNNNVFNEISAIADELRRSGALSIKELKNLYKKLH